MATGATARRRVVDWSPLLRARQGGWYAATALARATALASIVEIEVEKNFIIALARHAHTRQKRTTRRRTK